LEAARVPADAGTAAVLRTTTAKRTSTTRAFVDLNIVGSFSGLSNARRTHGLLIIYIILEGVIIVKREYEAKCKNL
jgi:hypothetical protein